MYLYVIFVHVLCWCGFEMAMQCFTAWWLLPEPVMEKRTLFKCLTASIWEDGTLIPNAQVMKKIHFLFLSHTHISIYPFLPELITKAFLSTGRPFSLSSPLPNPLHQVSSFSWSPCRSFTQSDMKLTMQIHKPAQLPCHCWEIRNKPACMLPPSTGTRKSFYNKNDTADQ